MKELLEEIRENWDDTYWWANHQFLQVALLGVIAGAISLFFAIAQAVAVKHINGGTT